MFHAPKSRVLLPIYSFDTERDDGQILWHLLFLCMVHQADVDLLGHLMSSQGRERIWYSRPVRLELCLIVPNSLEHSKQGGLSMSEVGSSTLSQAYKFLALARSGREFPFDKAVGPY